MKEKILNYLKNEFSHYIHSEPQINSNIPTFYIRSDGILQVLQSLKESEFKLNFLNDLTAIDWLGKRTYRFEVCYMLRSTNKQASRILLKVPLGEGESVPSIVSLFKGANWPEREVFDLFGINFTDHPNLERIIMPDSFQGYPLRKDYPLEGFGQDYLIEDLLEAHKKGIAG